MKDAVGRTLAAAGLSLGLTLGAPAAKAALIPIDDPVLGPASIVLDTTTGLEWLSFRTTRNQSQLEASLRPGEALALAGFRWPRRDTNEVCDLFVSSGYPFPCATNGFDFSARERFV